MQRAVGLLGRFAGAFLLAAAAFVPAASARAAEGLHGSLAVTSEYLFRGISHSDGRAAVQGALSWWHPTGFYAGAWASTTDLANDYYYPGADAADLEIELSAGRARRIGDDWTVDARLVGYLYPDDPSPVSYDWAELSVGAGWRNRLFGTLAATPRTTWLARSRNTRGRAAMTAELSVQQPLGAWLTGSLGAGWRAMDAPGTPHYRYASAGLQVQWRRGSVELAHHRTDARAERLFGPRLAGAHTVLTLTAAF